MANELTKFGAVKDSAEALQVSTLPPISQLRNTIGEMMKMQQKRVWENRGDCSIARTLRVEINMEKTNELLSHRKHLVTV